MLERAGENMNIQINKIAKAYSGKNGECCCGCSGKYYYPGTSNNASRQAERIGNILNENASQVEELNPNQYSLELGARLYIVEVSN